ncbi:alpha/beta-hydrolase [Aspergillus campestris IBT 28561]|uniref:Alpha/beta-hydrolase n=1 Tax=Aspergillus campestris (strain IBT 28561) TaxID=1392248 RepID=A0A2I1DEJ7_ASPC2|nr:alpha/beta-hydrolase [Aspergillus campestris IBT 28561]PKY08298.1 alpha/beta-hydrolase [Aspergillus campestris IBT 28561]
MSYFSYLVFSGGAQPSQQYYTRDGVLAVSQGFDELSLWRFGGEDTKLPVLCTRTSAERTRHSHGRYSRDAVRVASEGNTYVGLRDRKSFRFLGIPYADPPQRFTYSELYSKKTQTIKATEYGPSCAQVGRGSEDCLFLNIQTPYIPKKGSTNGLKPVLLWIHGGGLVEGSGSDPLTDGGNLASREDIVVVSFNYRLSTLGFLAVPGSDIRGNYGIADQIIALEWTIQNIAQFGGDPQHITIVGEFTDTGSARVLLESSPAVGKFHGAIAIPEVGSRGGLGHQSDINATHDQYLKPEESYRIAGQQIFSAAGCTSEHLVEQISCLGQVPASTLVGLDTVARYVVQDGHYVNTRDPHEVGEEHGSADVPIMFVVTADDASSRPSSSTQHKLEIPKSVLDVKEGIAQGPPDQELSSYDEPEGIASGSSDTLKQGTPDFGIQCVNQVTTFADTSSRVTNPSYFCHMGRSSAESGPAGLEVSSAMAEFLRGAPILPYFRLHRGDQQLPLIFGNMSPRRQARDLHSVQLASAYFGEFVRSGRPAPSPEYMKARGYLKPH